MNQQQNGQQQNGPRQSGRAIKSCTQLVITAGSSLLTFGSVMSFFGEWSVSELNGFCVFFEDDSTDLRKHFFKV